MDGSGRRASPRVSNRLGTCVVLGFGGAEWWSGAKIALGRNLPPEGSAIGCCDSAIIRSCKRAGGA
jgi:hypothetical protein